MAPSTRTPSLNALVRWIQGFMETLKLLIANTVSLSTASENNPTIQLVESPQRCHLLGLPAELRNRIWTFAVHQPDPIILNGDLSFHGMKGMLDPPLSLTNRQIRREALAIFFSENIFVAYMSSTFENITDKLTDAKLKMLRHVTISPVASTIEEALGRLEWSFLACKKKGLDCGILFIELVVGGDRQKIECRGTELRGRFESRNGVIFRKQTS